MRTARKRDKPRGDKPGMTQLDLTAAREGLAIYRLVEYRVELARGRSKRPRRK